MTPEQQIESHYQVAHLYEVITHALRDAEVDLNNVTWEDISKMDEFHVRGLEVTKELAGKTGIDSTMHILDDGCGIGGSSRMLAATYDCFVTGIDLTGEYIKTAQLLSKLTKLDHRTNFVQGSATALPYEENSFDIVWTQHVQMNIQDKKKFYEEAGRVLKPGGKFIYYDIFKTGKDHPVYPVPWAEKESNSFLITAEELHLVLEKTGFIITDMEDHTQKGIDFFESQKNKAPDKLNLGVIIGESAKEKFGNLLFNLRSGNLVIESAVCLKK